MRTRLDRYVLREILGPLGLGFLVYTFILLLQYLFQSAEMIIQRGLPLSTVGSMLLYILPSLLVLTIPMSLLFAILIAIGRLASDSELIALRSSGISLMTLFRPILILSTVLTAVNIYMMVSVVPHSNHASELLRLEILTRSVSQQVQPRVFYEEWEGKVVYVFDIPPGQNRWEGVFLADAVPRERHQVVMAEWGEPRVDDAGEVLVLYLENAYIHTMNLKDPSDYQLSYHERLEIVLEDQFTSRQRAQISATKSIRERDLGELMETIESTYSSDEERNLAWVQIHKNFSIPTACLVFGLLALPLGFNNRRGGKTSGFVLSLLVIIVYWFVLSYGEDAARYGKVEPWLAMWFPNILLGIVGLVLLIRRDRDKSLVLGRVNRAFYALLHRVSTAGERRRQRRQAGTGEGGEARAPRGGRRRRKTIIVRLPQFRLRFPNLMDRYVIRTFGGIFVLVLASGLTLFIIADLMDIFDDITKNQVPHGVVLTYFQYQSLQIFYTICPILVLVTTLMTYSLLSRTNEVIAFKALGVSLFRLSAPAVIMSFLIAGFAFLLQSEVLPASNRRVAQLKDQIKGREAVRTYRRADRQWLFGHERFIYNYLHYEPRNKTIQRLQAFEFDENHNLIGRIFTNQAKYDGEYWIMDQGWNRSFDRGLITFYKTFDQPRRSDFPETPDFFTSEIRPPEQMGYRELQEYIDELAQRGDRDPELQVELYNKISFPTISLVMALVALPFAFRLGRQGALYGIGVAVVLGMVYMALFVFFSTLGKAGGFPPLLAVWSPNLIFATFSLYLFLGVRT